jgi:hypothetical protein
MFVRKFGVDGGTGGVRGESHDKFGEYEGLLTLRCGELKVVLLKDNDPSSELAVNLLLAIFLAKRIRYQKNGLKPSCPKFWCKCARD